MRSPTPTDALLSRRAGQDWSRHQRQTRATMPSIGGLVVIVVLAVLSVVWASFLGFAADSCTDCRHEVLTAVCTIWALNLLAVIGGTATVQALDRSHPRRGPLLATILTMQLFVAFVAASWNY